MTEVMPRRLYAPTPLMDRMEAPPPEGFDLARWLEVRFGDTDMMGHVNNSAYAAYFETLRFFYLSRILAPDELTVARVEINFRLPAQFGSPVLGSIRVERCGERSVEFVHELSVDGVTMADGRSVLVALDGAESTALSDDFRAAVRRIQGADAERTS
jgi:acyl-CoA thioester hydrolase